MTLTVLNVVLDEFRHLRTHCVIVEEEVLIAEYPVQLDKLGKLR